ncbi:MAG: DNA primase [Acidithiobacillales bacterium SG8_45]|jgi:DNA primase|nr:MAG: DNA primase [Acidithiobacillales bacterium SG8_45]
MAGRIPEKFIDDLLARVDIVDVIDARVPLKKAGKDYKACCPFHEEKTPSFTVSADKQFYHCFGCGEHGTAIGFLMNYDRMSFPEAVRELAAKVGMEVPEEAQASTETVSRNDALLELMKQADQYYRRQLREHPDASRATGYLKGRGLSGEIAAEFGLGFAPPGWDNLIKAVGRDEQTREDMVTAGLAVKKDQGGYYDRFRERVMFPIHDYRGRIVGFGGRVIGEGEPKYLNSPETPLFHKGREVYGLYRGRDTIRQVQRVLVVEGYMDVVALAQYGINYAVATLGTATTRDHLERLFRFTPEVVFAFDGDRAGREAAWRALENVLPIMESGRQVSFLFLPEGEDPDSMVRNEGTEKFAERIDNARPLGEYLIDSLVEKVDLSRMDGRARLVELARPLIEKLPDGVFRQMLVDRLGEKGRVNAENLSTLLGNPQQTASSRHSVRGTPSRPAQRAVQQKSTLMRHAIAMVLQHPALAAAVDLERLQRMDLPGAPLLAQVVERAAEAPQRSTGALVELFRETEHYQPLQKLAVWIDPASEVATSERDLQRELTDVLSRLNRQALQGRIEVLTSKDALTGLNTAEKQELVALLAEKGSPGPTPESD